MRNEDKFEDKGKAGDGRSGVISRLFASQKRQAREFVADIVRMRGLTPLLMKHRNGGTWSAEEKSQLLAQLRILSRISPYLLFLLLPGSALLLPVYAWWLDRRRRPRANLPVSAPLR
ncbi:hypothetical protein [Propionivibrio sp.]|uniref:hypothetical protein n=1 Tax=Propionivibrio sp. TaxID=2212460 RepID=UPI003BF1BB21